MFKIPFSVAKSQIIKKDIAEVFKTVADFNTWKHWSPWLCQEKTCEVEIKFSPGQKKHYQTWKGEIIGQGAMELIALKENERLEYVLDIIKPWKSSSEVSFTFEKTDEGTKVTWSMEGFLPFFLFFMKKAMGAWIGNDYHRGLSMLKDYLETGEVLSDSEYYGVSSKKAFYYVGTTRSCAIEAMPRLMEQDLNFLHEKLKAGEIAGPQKIISLYHIFDLVNDYCEYTVAFTYKSLPEKDAGLPNGFVKSHKVLQVNHLGSYKHLGNAWATLMSYKRASRKKKLILLPMYEIYKSRPGEKPEAETLTEVYMPIR